jgi:hypothetical protein
MFNEISLEVYIKGDDIASVISLGFYDGRSNISEILTPLPLLCSLFLCDHNEGSVYIRLVQCIWRGLLLLRYAGLPS